MNLEGEIVLTRTLLASDVWLAEEPMCTRAAFVDLLLLANNRKSLPFVRGKAVEVRPGQVAWSIKGLMARWKWNFAKTKGFLCWLRERGTIEFTQNGDDTVIRFVNYHIYNPDEPEKFHESSAKVPAKDHESSAEVPSDAPQKFTERELEQEQEVERKAEPPVFGGGTEVGVPPVPREVLWSQAQVIGCSAACFEWFWNQQEGTGWVTGPNKLPIRKPLPLLQNAMTWFRARETQSDTSAAPDSAAKKGGGKNGGQSLAQELFDLETRLIPEADEALDDLENRTVVEPGPDAAREHREKIRKARAALDALVARRNELKPRGGVA